jgi:3-deoxy-D-arabino-heptulosonate 7-phosphate (DAHP) synthase
LCSPQVGERKIQRGKKLGEERDKSFRGTVGFQHAFIIESRGSRLVVPIGPASEEIRASSARAELARSAIRRRSVSSACKTAVRHWLSKPRALAEHCTVHP